MLRRRLYYTAWVVFFGKTNVQTTKASGSETLLITQENQVGYNSGNGAILHVHHSLAPMVLTKFIV